MKIIGTGILALVGVAALQSAAMAGGFARGEANTDILFDDGKAVIEGGAVYVSPRRTYDTISGVKATDGAYSDNYWIPSLAIKADISDSFACALTYTQPFGGSSTYGSQANAAEGAALGNYSINKHFTTNEYGTTCDVKFDAGPGKLHILGGVFLEDFNYTAESYYGTLKLHDDSAFGYRVGTAYEIPEYAMRAELMYRSEVKHDADGKFIPDAIAALVGSTPLPSDGQGTLPQSLKLSLQSGVAPGWLVYGSVKWMDWSVLDALDYNITALGAQQDIYNWRDGWTVQAGVGHSFTDDIAGTVNITWDKGVGTGADIMTDTWTLGAGGSIKAGPGKLLLGVGISYLTAGSQSVAKGANYDATAGNDWAYALSASYNVKF